MANVTRNIGLSLGADICWPGCYEEIVKRLNLSVPHGGDTLDFHVERVTVEPYFLRQPVRYDVVLDRLTHWFHTSREWIKKAVIMDGLYVLNNPWSLQSMEKHSTYCAMMKLGMPIPETWMIPPKEMLSDNPDVHPTMERYGRHFKLDEIGERLGYPFFMKPYDGGAWVGVSRIDNPRQLHEAYESSGKRVMHLQKAVDPFDLFVRAIGVGPQVHIVKYDPGAPLHDRYKVDFFFVDGEEWQVLTDTCLTINAFFGWEFNSCESLRKDGVFHPIDFANACPDFQVTSLHYHFPEMVKNMVRWSLFCAATKRERPMNLDWKPFFAIAKQDLPYRERLKGYAKIANERMETDRFREWCDKHLSHLDEVALEFFGTDVAKGYVRQKVSALFPQHEVPRFTEHFWGLIQFWRKTETDRLNHVKSARQAQADAGQQPIHIDTHAPEHAPQAQSPGQRDGSNGSNGAGSDDAGGSVSSTAGATASGSGDVETSQVPTAGAVAQEPASAEAGAALLTGTSGSPAAPASKSTSASKPGGKFNGKKPGKGKN